MPQKMKQRLAQGVRDFIRPRSGKINIWPRDGYVLAVPGYGTDYVSVRSYCHVSTTLQCEELRRTCWAFKVSSTLLSSQASHPPILLDEGIKIKPEDEEMVDL
jgi:hypothetical protein